MPFFNRVSQNKFPFMPQDLDMNKHRMTVLLILGLLISRRYKNLCGFFTEVATLRSASAPSNIYENRAVQLKEKRSVLVYLF